MGNVLEGPLLVTRSPCIQSGDVQMVEGRYHKKLAHLQDVVVCSSLGTSPLLSQLSGGDYDGRWIEMSSDGS